ncbi:MAG: PLP-dependent aminotransferase family protein [Geminicoccaceae bacterium]|nr:PLP-dependent aminotransferase family protein [Geminicoccaceae bacterium]
MIEDWRLPEDGTPRYRALARLLERRIERGEMRPGARLPPQRQLAYRLGVTIGTVGRAYELLIGRGLARGEVGRGTFVRDPAVTPGSHGSMEERPASIDLTTNAPLPIAETDELSRLLGDILARSPNTALFSAYPPTQGTLAHRRAAAAWLAANGTAVDPERVVLTGGGQPAIAAALSALTRPGDGVLLEAFTYSRFVTLATTLGLRPHAIAIDEHGLVPAALDAALRQQRGRVLVLSPNLSNPTTAMLPPERREELLAIVRRHDAAIVEDDVYGPLVESRPPSLAALDPERVVHVTSLSKFLAPALRIGVMAVPPRLLGAVVQRHADLALAAPALLHELLATAQTEGLLARAQTAQRLAIRDRQAAVRQVLRAGPIRSRPEALHVWLHLPPGVDAETLALSLAGAGIRVATARAFAVEPRDAPAALRLSIGGPLARELLLGALGRIDAAIVQGPTADAI